MIRDKRYKPPGSIPEDAGKLGADVVPSGELGTLGDLDDDMAPDDALTDAKHDPRIDRKEGTDQLPKKSRGEKKVQQGVAPITPSSSGQLKFPPRVLIVPPKYIGYPEAPGRTRHEVHWEAFDAASGAWVAGDADEGLLRRLVLEAGSQVV